MRWLDRGRAAAPRCLAKFRAGRDRWDDHGNAALVECKAAIGDRLEAMQGRRCAYCEGDLDERGRHIEHFRSRARFTAETFEWENLLLSCDARDSCGHFKDSQGRGYEIDDLLDPCRDDPDGYLRVRVNGVIEPRPGLDERAAERARVTVRVLNLNLDAGHRSLRARRRRALAVYRASQAALLEALAEFSPEDRQAFIAEEIAARADEPFTTIIRHFFVYDL